MTDVDKSRRTRRPSNQLNVQSILDSAAKVLRERGINGYGTNAVAEVGEHAVGTIYRFFPKGRSIKPLDQITVALLAQQRESLRLQILSPLTGVEVSRPSLRLINSVVGHFQKDPDLTLWLDLEEQRLGLDPSGSLRGLVCDQLQSTAPRLKAYAGAQRQTLAEQMTALIFGMARSAARITTPIPGHAAEAIFNAVDGFARGPYFPYYA